MNLAAIVALLGIAEIVSWGKSLLQPRRAGSADPAGAGPSDVLILGAFSAGLLASGEKPRPR